MQAVGSSQLLSVGLHAVLQKAFWGFEKVSLEQQQPLPSAVLQLGDHLPHGRSGARPSYAAEQHAPAFDMTPKGQSHASTHLVVQSKAPALASKNRKSPRVQAMCMVVCGAHQPDCYVGPVATERSEEHLLRQISRSTCANWRSAATP